MKQATVTRSTPRGNKNELNIKQRIAAGLLAAGHTIESAAREVGVNEKTVDVWKRRPDFKACITQAEDAIYAESMRLLKRTAKAAIVTLISCMSEKTSAYVRVQAARSLLEFAFEVNQHAEIEERMEVLEELVDERYGTNRR